MLMSCQGVPDAVFLKKLNKAKRAINVEYMMEKIHRRAEGVIDSEQKLDQEAKDKLLRQMKMFFGPSKEFSSVFKAVLLRSVEWNN